jgi:hypothetical protein
MAHQSSQGLASLGRNGDSMLVHMSPSEVAGLQGLAMSQGGSLSINPHTGLPEAFSLGGFFKSLLPTLVGGIASMIPGMQFASYPMLTGILAGSATGALTNKNKLLGAITGGLGGYSGAGIMGAGKAAGTAMGGAETAGSIASNTPYQGGWVNPETATGAGFGGAATTGADLAQNNAIINNAAASGMTNSGISGASAGTSLEKALASGNQIGMANVNNFTAGVKPDPTFLGNMGNAFKGMGGAATGNQAAIDAYTKGIGAESAMGALGKTALPIGGAAITGGLEPSDLYGEPVQNASKDEKYDPYSRLNLNQDTGLRLVAKGGAINSYAQGGTIAAGGINNLYGSNDDQVNTNLSRDGYGIGRLNTLASQESLNNAKTLGYAEGGVANLELPDPTVAAAQPIAPEASVLNEVAKTQENENQLRSLGIGSLGSGNVPTNNYAPGSLATIASAMKNQNVPPEASFVQNLTGARTGYAEGGETHMNLNDLPTLNVNTGVSSLSAPTIPDGQHSDLYNRFYAIYGDKLNTPTQSSGPNSANITSFGDFLNRAIPLGGMARGGNGSFARGGYLDGQGDGMSDSIPATIEGKQPARLADGEFVVPADVVSHIGNGSSKAGSKRLYSMLDKVRKARTGHTKQGKQIKPEKYMPA